MKMFVTINKDSLLINADVNVNNSLIKVVVIKDLFGILIIIKVNVINIVILENRETMKYASVEKGLVDKLIE